MAVQTGFVLALGIPLIRHRDPKTFDNHQGVSVIIAARNEAKNLNQLLQRLKEQDQEYPYEVIVVNDRSTDQSALLLNEWQKQWKALTVVDVESLPAGWTGKKYALFCGVQKARFSKLLFTDADCLPASDQWIQLMGNALANDYQVVLGYSPYAKRKGWLNRFIQYETLWVAMQYLGFALWKKPYMGVGRNWAVAHQHYDLDFLKKIGHLEGGDDDLMVGHLSKTHSIQILIEPAAFTVSTPKETLKSYLHQKIRHLSAGKHYDKKDQTLLGIFTLSCVVGWGLFFWALATSSLPSWIWTAFGVRCLLNYAIIRQLGQKLKTEIEIWSLPFLDLCYCFYYPLVAIKALATKQVEWK
jgi:glycosyltransferase involved in cell wall biosynthesis